MEITQRKLDAIKELLNIGVGRAAEILNSMLQSHIDLEIPSILVLSSNDIKKELDFIENELFAGVEMKFKGTFTGKTKLVFSYDSAKKLVYALTGENRVAEIMDSLMAGTLSEIGNIVINAIMGSISNVLNLNFEYSVPEYEEGSYEKIFAEYINRDFPVIMCAKTKFLVTKFEISGELVLFLEITAYDKISELIDNV